MSTYYYIYTETKIDDKWRLVDPYVRNLEDDSLKLSETYWNGSRSYFGEAYDKLSSNAKVLFYKDLSEELQKEFNEYQDECEFMTCRLEYVKDMIGNNRFSHHGVVSKDALELFNTGDIEELYPMDPEDVSKISYKEFDLTYKYHEWDNPDDWLYHFKKIKDSAEFSLSKFNDANYLYENEDVRLIIYRC